MIVDSLSNVALYESVHPRFKKAFDFLLNSNLDTLPEGKIELEGAEIYVIVTNLVGKTPEEAKMETHQLYIDIQMPITASETLGWIAGDKLSTPTVPYNSEKDVAFYSDIATNFIVLQPYQFAIFFPSDGHQPGIAEGTHRKVIVKILA